MIIPEQTGFVQSDNIEIDDKTTITGKSFLFDFEAGEFVIENGKPVEVTGIEALKVWIDKVLRTPINKYSIYIKKDEYGIEDLKELITSDLPYPFIKAEIERLIKETLLKNTAIKSVQNFGFERNRRLLTVSFDCYTIYGTIQEVITV